jgi:hypothetical protein
VGKDAHLPATGQALLQVGAGLLAIGTLCRLGGVDAGQARRLTGREPEPCPVSTK